MSAFSRRDFLKTAFTGGLACTFTGPALALNTPPSKTLLGRRLILDEGNNWGREKAKFLSSLSDMPLTHFDSLANYLGTDPEKRIAKINAEINQTPYLSDQTRFGVPDKWADPDDFVLNGGDCEDFALAKYKFLAQVGLPVSQMYVIGVHSRNSGQAHASLIVEQTNSTLVLDNTSDQLISEADYQKDYAIAYALCQNGLWRPDV